MVLFTSLWDVTILLNKYPDKNPKKCNVTTAPANLVPELSISSFPCPMMLATMSTIATTAINGATGSSFLVKVGRYLFIDIPSKTGTRTTLIVPKKSWNALTSILSPIRKVVNNGVKAIAKRVDTAVIVTDSATLAFAM
jgi:hypothetical protein